MAKAIQETMNRSNRRAGASAQRRDRGVPRGSEHWEAVVTVSYEASGIKTKADVASVAEAMARRMGSEFTERVRRAIENRMLSDFAVGTWEARAS